MSLTALPRTLSICLLVCLSAGLPALEPSPEPPAGAAAAGSAAEADPHHLPLAGTSWRLIQIMSMDDSTYRPDDPDRYTLSFSDDAISIVADCNRGTGSWTAKPTGELQFGVIAATRAMCPPESLHDRYLAQFPWVRSYVTESGHLFLATMADGAIIEFEPVSVGD